MSPENYREYELFYFLPITLTPEEITVIKEKIGEIVAKYQGQIIKDEEYGKKKLAYQIKRIRHGHYILTILSLEPSTVAKVSHEIKLLPEIIRHRLVTKENIPLPRPESPSQVSLEEKQPETPEKPEFKTEKILGDKVDISELDRKINELLSDDNL
jgi:small subunit ribosomal protein S6